MDLALLIYGISVLGSIIPILGILVGISGAACLGLLIYLSDTYESQTEKKAWAWKRIKFWFGTGIFILFVMALLPSEKTAYTMVGAYAAQKVVENDKVQEMSGKVLKVIEQKLDGYIEEGVEAAKQAVKEKVSK